MPPALVSEAPTRLLVPLKSPVPVKVPVTRMSPLAAIATSESLSVPLPPTVKPHCWLPEASYLIR